MRMWAKNTSRAALVAAGALAVGAAAVAPANAFYGGGGHDGKVTMLSAGNLGVLNGNQAYAPISIPIDVCGNAIAIAGLSKAQCEGGAKVSSQRSGDGYEADRGYRADGGWDGGGGGHGKSVDMLSFLNIGAANGNQAYAPISVPVNVCGNSVAAVLAFADAQCKGGASVKRSGGRDVDMKSAGNIGLLNGNQLFIPISIPIDVCGNSVAAVLAAAQAQCKGGASVGDGGDHEVPPTLRTPPVKKHKKPYKPSKHRPAAKHKKLPSTMRADGRRMADGGANYRTADGMPAVQDLLRAVGKVVKVPGVDVQQGQLGPQLPNGAGAPVRVGTPVLK
ncbi:chaplin family protein [Actinomadura sp. GTD37]|uniref:chaplin family protein n=1 Tax=Actinomadura sp. GTD37 TaxID=1778030 RepID=UPI0035C1EAF6